MRIAKILVVFLFPSLVLAQWSVTPELGANLIPVSKTDLGNEFRLGWHVGSNVSYDFNDYFSLSTGIFATQKQKTYQQVDTSEFTLFGFEAQLDSVGLNRSIITRTNGAVSLFFLELPVLATYTYENFSVFGGPYVAYGFSVRRKETQNTQTPLLQSVDLSNFGLDPSNPLIAGFLPPVNETTFEESSNDKGLRKIDVGFKVGARYAMDQLSFALAYQRGIFDYELSSSKSKKEIHQYLQLTIGYRFDFY